MVLPWPLGRVHSGSTSEWRLCSAAFEHAPEVARVVPTEIGVDEQQEVDAVLERLVHEELHVRAFAHSRARGLQHHLRDPIRPRRETSERVVVARLVGERKPAVVRRAEHGRAGFDAIGQLDDAFRFVPGWDTDQESCQEFLREYGRDRLPTERQRLSGGR